MLRPCAGILLSLSLMSPSLAVASPDAGANKDTAAVAMDKVQTRLKDTALLEIQGWRLAAQLYLFGAQGKSATELSQLQKIRAGGSRLAGRCDSAVQAAWSDLSAAVNEAGLDANGKPGAATHKTLLEKLEALSNAVDQSLGETRKEAKLPARGPSDALKDAATRFEQVVMNHLSGVDDPEYAKQISQLNVRFENLANTYKTGDTAKSVQEARAKWPVLREALTKGKEKSPVFIISRFHDQVADELGTAMEALPRY